MQDIKKVKKEMQSEAQQGNVEKQSMTEISSKKRKNIKLSISSKMLPWVLAVVVLVAGLAGTLYYKSQADKVASNPDVAQQEKNQAETDRVLAALKKILFIGETEAPTVARVEDPEKLKSSNAAFYKDIQQGDYLVIYPKRAIIFRENINQVINMAPIINSNDLQNGEGTTPAETTPAPAPAPTTRKR